MKEYTSFRYLYPPRPEMAAMPSFLKIYEDQKWVAQYKKNGTCSIIAISPSNEIITMSRHAQPHKAWQISDSNKQALQSIFKKEKFWIVLVAEILHSKTKTIKNTIYIHDVIVWDKFLLGSTFIDRQKILSDKLIKPNLIETTTHYVVESNIWFAKLYLKNFEKCFNDIEDPSIDEGLVLKDPKGKLRVCNTPSSNSNWQIKIRKPTKSYNW